MSTTTQHYQLVGWACILALFVLVRHANCESPTPLANPHNSDSHDEPVSHNTSSCCAQSSSDRQASLLTSSLPLPRTTAAASQRHLTQQQTPAPAPAPAAPDHKPLFPVNSLDIAVLVIAGVVLFIAAGGVEECQKSVVCVLLASVSQAQRMVTVGRGVSEQELQMKAPCPAEHHILQCVGS